MLDQYGLTAKQRAWCDLYIKLGNATEAARQAGYKDPEHSGKDNSHKQPCKAYIDARMQPTVEKRIASADDVLQFLTATMHGKIKDQFGLDPSLSDRINAAKELMKRYAVADQRAQGTMAKLDAILLQFTTAVNAPEGVPGASIPIGINGSNAPVPANSPEDDNSVFDSIPDADA